MDNTVKISVIMPTYNTELPILKMAVGSILDQIFRDFEFIIIDDGSTNQSLAYLESLSDKRIRLMRNDENIGITKCLNIGIKAARGKYIARMDADDVSLPERLEEQYKYMENHPDLLLSGTDVQLFGDAGRVSRVFINDQDIYRIKLLFGNPGPIHPTIIINRDLLMRFQIQYNEELQYSQDYGLYASAIRYGCIANLNKVLLLKRVHSRQICIQHRNVQIHCDKKVQKRLLQELIESITNEELDRHYRWAYEKRILGFFDSLDCLNWYSKLARANAKKGIYKKGTFIIFIIRIYLQLLLPESWFSAGYTIASRFRKQGFK